MTSDKPIYILGGNTLAYYLGAKFTDVEKRVVFLTDTAEKNKLNTQGISLKESFSLRKKHYNFENSSWMKEEAELLLVTAEMSSLHSLLSRITPEKINGVPVVCFTLLKDSAYLRDILGCSFCRAIFEGWLLQDNRQITFLEKTPAVTIYTPLNEQNAALAETVFSEAGINLTFSDNENQTFWKRFGVCTAGSLITAAYNQNITQCVKNREAAAILNLLCEELSALAKSDNIDLPPRQILEEIYNIPAGFAFPLSGEVKNGVAAELNLISSEIMQAAKKLNYSPPKLHDLIRYVYNTYLSIT